MPPRARVLGDLAGFATELLRSLRAVVAGGILPVLAIELASRIVGTLLVGLSGLVGAESAVGGLALTAVASIVRLVAMVLQILVLLRAMRSAPPPLAGASRVQAALAGIGTAVLPAFVLLSAWGLFQEDLRAYALAALSGIDWFADGAGVGAVLDVPVDVLTISLLVGCLVLRGVLRRFERGGRRSVAAVALLLEGLWTFLAISVLARVVGTVGDWLGGTRLAAVTEDASDAIARAVGDLPVDAWTWLGATWHALTVPLVWLTLVGIVLVGARPEVLPDPSAPSRIGGWWSRLLDALPSPLDDALEELTDDLHDRWVPIATTLQGLRAAGVVAIAATVLAWYVLQAAGGWLAVLLAHALGPQPQHLADAVASIGLMAGDAVTQALSLALAAAALDALRIRARRDAAQGAIGMPTHAPSTTASTRTSASSPGGTTKPTTPSTSPVSE